MNWNDLKKIKPDDSYINKKFLIYWIFPKTGNEGYAIATYYGSSLFSADNRYYDSRHVVSWQYLEPPHA